MNIMDLLFSFEGRINRSTWWIIYLCNFVFGIFVWLCILIPVEGLNILIFLMLFIISF